MGFGFLDGLKEIAGGFKGLVDEINAEGGISGIIESKKEDAEMARYINDHCGEDAAKEFLSASRVKIKPTGERDLIDKVFDKLDERMDDMLVNLHDNITNSYVDIYNAVSKNDWQYLIKAAPAIADVAYTIAPLKAVNWNLVGKIAACAVNNISETEDGQTILALDWKQIGSVLLQEKGGLISGKFGIDGEDVDRFIRISTAVANSIDAH